MVRSMMSYSSLPISFWGYSLQIAVYILNVVPSKSMLKGKTGKLEPCIEVCMFVGYPKGTRGGLFYSPSDKKLFVSTNATFLKDDYMTNFKPRSKVVL